MRVAGKDIGPDRPAFVVAELGINHNGSLELAFKLIAAAYAAGADAVKFQKRTIDRVYSAEELARPRESVFGSTNGDLKRGLEFGQDDYEAIDACCKRWGIPWFASAWDIESVHFLERFEVPVMKIASPCLTDVPLCEEILASRLPIFASVGMSEQFEVDDFYRRAVAAGAQDRLVLLCCTSTYPCGVGDLHLVRIPYLRERYGVPVGYSGHEVGLWTTLDARVLGACVIERHMTLDRAMWGSDQAASVEPGGFRKLVEEIRTFEEARGEAALRCLESEKPVRAKLRRSCN